MHPAATLSERLAVAGLLAQQESVLLAVSGGLDSVCLAHMAVAARERTSLAIATFDHRTGPHSAAATRFVAALGRRLGLPVYIGRAMRRAHTESEWRASRWAFLRETAAQHAAVVATAHTRDDHLETVVMRILRGAGARGLAGLLAESPGIVRPLLDAGRDQLANYAQQMRLSWIEDPTNQSRRFFRNRVRLDLLPALQRADPSLAGHLLRLAADAASLRRAAERIAAGWAAPTVRGVRVSDVLLTFPNHSARAFAWPAALGPQGIILDRRGLVRLARLDADTSPGYRVPLSGGWEALRVPGGVNVRRTEPRSPPMDVALPRSGSARLEGWRFTVAPAQRGPESLWQAVLPATANLIARPWRDGDRMAGGPEGRPRRVKRYFADLKIPACEREGWPVVVANGEIIWIPGVRRATAASVRSGRPARLVVCERLTR